MLAIPKNHTGRFSRYPTRWILKLSCSGADAAACRCANEAVAVNPLATRARTTTCTVTVGSTLETEPALPSRENRGCPLAGHARETDQCVRLGPGPEDRCLGVRADVRHHLEVPEGAATLGVGLALGDALRVEVRHL